MIETGSVVTVKGITRATILCPDYGTVNEETVLIGYVMEDSQERCFTAPISCVTLGTPRSWGTATD